MTGLAAALFAANRGIETLRVGVASEMIFASGFIDLMGVHPVDEGRIREDPWQAIACLKEDIPGHPYNLLTQESIRSALVEFVDCLGEAGVAYRWQPDRNVRAILPVGTVKPTWAVPASMWNGVDALKNKPPGLVVGIHGLRGFSARQIAETLKTTWPDLRHATVVFPGYSAHKELYTERMARSIMLAETRKRLADAVRPHLGPATVVGFPAVFGIQGTHEVISDMEARIGRPIFEIPTMPPSIPGLRIKEAMDSQLEQKGVRSLVPERVTAVRFEKDHVVLTVGNAASEHRVRADAAVLATGRFVGMGLTADRKRIREALLDLPVHQPGARKNWHRQRFLDLRGHAINRAGIEVDHRFRPLDPNNRPAWKHLYSAGSILAHQDWMRMKCGAGLAIATAFGAVQSFLGTPV